MIKNRKAFFKIMILIIIAIAVISAFLIIMAWKRPFGNKQPSTEDYAINLSEKFAENEKVKISIENVGYVGDYLILKYDIKAKDESSEIFDDSMIVDGEFDFHLPRRVLINNKTIEVSEQYYDQISHRISGNEVVLYDVINVGLEDIPDKFDVEVRFYENDYTIYAELDETDIEEDELIDEADDAELVEWMMNIDPDEYYAQSEFEVDPNSVQKSEEDEGFLEEYATEDDYEEVTGEYIPKSGLDEEREKILDQEESEIIGTISFRATKEEMSKGCENAIVGGEYEIDNVTVKNVMVIKTPFDNFLLMDTEIDNVSSEIVYRNTAGDPYTYAVDVQDENGVSIKLDKAQEVQIYYDTKKQFQENMANIRTLILLDNSADVFIIQPYYNCENSVNIGDGFFVDRREE